MQRHVDEKMLDGGKYVLFISEDTKTFLGNYRKSRQAILLCLCVHLQCFHSGGKTGFQTQAEFNKKYHILDVERFNEEKWDLYHNHLPSKFGSKP